MVHFIVNKLRKFGLYDTKFFIFLKGLALRFVGRHMKKYGVEALGKVSKVLEESKVEYWADFGTLLGIYREGKLLSHDMDIDMGIMRESYSEEMEQNLLKEGFMKLKEFTVDGEIVEQTWKWNGVLIDLFFYERKEGKICAYEFYTKGESVITKIDDTKSECTDLSAMIMYLPDNGTKVIEFNGYSLRVPSNEDEYLKSVYGPSYMVPDKNWSSDSMTNIMKLDKVNMRCVYYKI
ncbi:MAG: LicD family protein [Clostridium sp.]